MGNRFGGLVGRRAGAGVFVGLFAPQSLWPALLVNQGAGLLVLVAGLQSAWWITQWRARAMNPSVLVPVAITEEVVVAEGWYERLLDGISQRWLRLLGQIGAPTLWLGGWALLSLYSIEQVWNLALPPAALGLSASVGAALSLLLAFGLLVLERQLAQENVAQWPEAGSLAQLARVAIIGLVLSALCLLFGSETAVWPVRLAVLIGLLPGLVAIELLLRAVLSLFSPVVNSLNRPCWREASSPICCAGRHSPCSHCSTSCTIASVSTCDKSGPSPTCSQGVLPVLAVVAIVGWSLTGIHEIPLQGRGIYERFGKPVEVFGPGLHAGLPWPLGRVLSVENGVVHELATSVGEASAPVAAEPAEGGTGHCQSLVGRQPCE